MSQESLTKKKVRDIWYYSCNVKMRNHTHYFDDKININNLFLDNILLDEKSYENIFMYNVAYKTLYGTVPLHFTDYFW